MYNLDFIKISFLIYGKKSVQVFVSDTIKKKTFIGLISGTKANLIKVWTTFRL